MFACQGSSKFPFSGIAGIDARLSLCLRDVSHIRLHISHVQIYMDALKLFFFLNFYSCRLGGCRELQGNDGSVWFFAIPKKEIAFSKFSSTTCHFHCRCTSYLKSDLYVIQWYG